MKSIKNTHPWLAIAALAAAAVAARAVETNGAPGAPSATTTISGKQLPAPDPKFGGVIKDNALQSKAWWAPRIVPPKNAPNVLLIMTDDSGFGVPSTYGGVIPTPAMDRIAKPGLKYTQFHSTALCSPTRAALITGRNHHSVGFGVLPIILQWDESMDFGSDTGTPVDDQDYQCPFTFTGKFSKITIKLGPEQLTPADRELLGKTIRDLD